MKKSALLQFSVLAVLSFAVACSKTGPDVFIPRQPDLSVDYDYSLKTRSSFFVPPFENAQAVATDSIVTVTSGFVLPGGVIEIDPNNPFINFQFGFSFNSENPRVTNAGATLGRVLFYDPQLSLNNSVACASCHKQNMAFADGEVGSEGFGGKVTPRNSMAIINPGFNNNLFWDSRSSSVLDLVTKPIQNHIEMGIEDMPALAAKLSKIDYYPTLFAKAFGSAYINEERIAQALAQFVCSISTTNSKFDVERSTNFAGFNSLEKMGMDLFFSQKANCAGCHSGANFAAADFPGGEYGETFGSEGNRKGTANIGLNLVYQDPGKSDGQFRIPSLRNVALTGPYMHDGRFKTLEDVVEHYNSGIAAHPKLDKKLRDINGLPKRLGLNELEKRALVAFLKTLTDETLLTDPKYSDPFK